MPDDPSLLGTVQDVKGATLSVALNPTTLSGLAFIAGRGYRVGQVGSFVRVPIGYVSLFGIVSQVGAGAVPEKLVNLEPYGHRWMTVELVGEGQHNTDFKRGVSQYPTIGDPVHLVTESDLQQVYGRPESPHFVSVGHLASATSIPALVDLDKLVTRHSAVVGTTGAGKSTTVVSLLLALSNPGLYPSARVIVLDIHGEYAAALKDRASVFRVNANEQRGETQLYIPYWSMAFEELLAVTFGPLDDQSRAAVLEKVTSLKLKTLKARPRKGVTADNLTVDSPVPFSIHALWFEFHRLMNATHTQSGGQSETTEAFVRNQNGDVLQPGDAMKVIPPSYMPHTQAAGQAKIYLSQSPHNFRRQLETLASRLRDPRFDFLFRPGQWTPDVNGVCEQDLDKLLEQWIGGTKPIAILDLSGIPVSVLNNLVGVLLRVIYDALFWSRSVSEGGRERPLLLVLEEAHSYVGAENGAHAAVAVRRIVKEGRKYGIGAMIVSQRPAEIDPTILSQCGTLFAMRLSNSADRSHVTSAVTDNLAGLLSLLPALRTGEAIIVGEGVHLPLRTVLDPPSPDRRPDSADPLVYDTEGPGGWNRAREESDYAEVVTLWRKQDPRSPHIV